MSNEFLLERIVTLEPLKLRMQFFHGMITYKVVPLLCNPTKLG